MFTCKQVSNALSKEDYDKLPAYRRFFLKLHVKLCVVCGKYNKQVMDSQDMCRCYREREKETSYSGESLGDDKKDALKKALQAEMRD